MEQQLDLFPCLNLNFGAICPSNFELRSLICPKLPVWLFPFWRLSKRLKERSEQFIHLDIPPEQMCPFEISCRLFLALTYIFQLLLGCVLGVYLMRVDRYQPRMFESVNAERPPVRVARHRRNQKDPRITANFENASNSQRQRPES